MVDDNFSCIKEVTKTVHITLPTACTSNEISGISDVLESWKRQYSQQLQAIVVSYKDVFLTNSKGFIKVDIPFVLHDVRATFQLFYPSVGSIVKGKINRISHDYIGCLIHNTINVTIDRSNDLPNFSNIIGLDRFILFEITGLGFKRKIIHVKGKITEECIKLMRESGMLNFDTYVSDNVQTSPDSHVKSLEELEDTFNNNVSEEISIDSGHHSPKKKKSKKLHNNLIKNNLSLNNTLQNSELETSTDTSSHISSLNKKKKHKKSKYELSSPPLFNESLDSEVNEIEPTQPLQTTIKKKHKSKSRENMNYLTGINSVLNVKNEILTDSSGVVSPIKSPQKKKSETVIKSSPQKNLLAENLSLQNPMDTNHLLSPSKKRKHKKSKEHLLKSPKKEVDSLSPPKKKQKKSKSETLSKDITNISSPLNVIKENLSENSDNLPKNFKDVYEMMDALSSFEPSAEAQLLSNADLVNSVKKEPLDTIKASKKRKRESSNMNSLPKKKRKLIDGKSTTDINKDKIHKKKKKKEKSKKDSKKDKEKSKKDSKKDKEKSKKDKKKKSKDKVISTKKKSLYKNHLKKKSKEKSKKPKIKKEKNL